jgi:hypothetical protein
VAADQQSENLLQHIAQQKHERKNTHGHQQRGEDLPDQIFVERIQGVT